MRFVEIPIDNQVALDFVIHPHVVRDTVRFFDEVGENHIPEHVRIQLFFAQIVTDEDFHEKTVDHHGIESGE